MKFNPIFNLRDVNTQLRLPWPSARRTPPIAVAMESKAPAGCQASQDDLTHRPICRVWVKVLEVKRGLVCRLPQRLPWGSHGIQKLVLGLIFPAPPKGCLWIPMKCTNAKTETGSWHCFGLAQADHRTALTKAPGCLQLELGVLNKDHSEISSGRRPHKCCSLLRTTGLCLKIRNCLCSCFFSKDEHNRRGKSIANARVLARTNFGTWA